MIVYRITASLAKKLKVKVGRCAEKSSTLLSDWTFHNLVLHRKQYIICVAEKSRLAVLINAAPYSDFNTRFVLMLRELLQKIGVPEPMIQKELSEMRDAVLAKTDNKSVLGCINEYKRALDYNSDSGRDNFAQSLKMSYHLSKTIFLKLPEYTPEESTIKLFSKPMLTVVE